LTATVYIALGSNLGDKGANLRTAHAAIAELAGTTVLAESSVEETEPIGPADQPTYLNQMLAVQTSLAPEQLLEELQAIEHRCGRVRGERWGARTLDLDIVKYGNVSVKTPTLSLPHPEISNRDFWQREIAELELVLGE
jgi:2-amino-4-hydroxy-6-hydroxymethyldihydropteridine diphosphokinase